MEIDPPGANQGVRADALHSDRAAPSAEPADRESYESFTAYMCKTSFEHDIEAADGTRIYLTERAIRRDRKCLAQCGLVEVQVTLKRVVQEEDFGPWLDAEMAKRGG